MYFLPLISRLTPSSLNTSNAIAISLV